MGKGNPIKAITKPVEKAVKNIVKAPEKIISGVAHGDVNKALNGAVNAVSYGTASFNDKSGIVDASKVTTDLIGGLTGTNALADSINNMQASQAAQDKAAAEALAKQQEAAKAAAISRRRSDLTGETKTVYTSALGDVANTAAGKTKKKTVLGG